MGTRRMAAGGMGTGLCAGVNRVILVRKRLQHTVTGLGLEQCLQLNLGPDAERWVCSRGHAVRGQRLVLAGGQASFKSAVPMRTDDIVEVRVPASMFCLSNITRRRSGLWVG